MPLPLHRYVITITVDTAATEPADVNAALAAATAEVQQQEGRGVREATDPRTSVSWVTVGPGDPPPT